MNAETQEMADQFGNILRALGASMIVGDWNGGGVVWTLLAACENNWEELALGVSLGTFPFAACFDLGPTELRKCEDLAPAGKLADQLWINFHTAASKDNSVAVAIVLNNDADQGHIALVVRDQEANILFADSIFVALEDEDRTNELTKNRVLLAPDIIEGVFTSLCGFAEACMKDNAKEETVND